MLSRVGKIGEEIAVKFLLNKGFVIKDRNYSKKFGELDIVAEKKKDIYFIEVKTLSANLNEFDKENFSQGQESRPEEKVDKNKLRRISRAAKTYILEKRLESSNYKFLVLSILYDEVLKTARVKVIEDVIPD